MLRTELSEVEVSALTICKAGANRKRIFLKKQQPDEPLALPSEQRLLKAADWSAFYCVVAEPDSEEDRGVIMKDGQLVPDPTEGVDVWASEDEIRKAAHRFMKNGALVTKMHESLAPYGAVVENAVALGDFEVNGDTIRKGSWYVAVEPTSEGRQAIEAGEFTGLSLEGDGVRTPVMKAEDDEKNHKLKCPKCGTVQAASNEKCVKCGHVLGDARKAKFAAMRKLDGMGLLTKLVEVLKGEDLLDTDPEAIAKELGTLTSEEESVDTITKEQFAGLEKKVDDFIGSTAPVFERLTKALDTAEAKREDEAAPKVADVKDGVDKLTDAVVELNKSMEKMAQGSSTQREDDGDPEAIRKAANAAAYENSLLG